MDRRLEGIGQGLSTNAGVTAMWAHMVAGDIFATRWIWQNSVKSKSVKMLRALVWWSLMRHD